MQIEFEFSGGYGGLFAARPLALHLDTDALSPERRERLLDLIDSSCVKTLAAGAAPPAPSPPGPQRDVFNYRLALRDRGFAKSFTFDDVTAPVALRPLLAFLRELALEGRSST